MSGRWPDTASPVPAILAGRRVQAITCWKTSDVIMPPFSLKCPKPGPPLRSGGKDDLAGSCLGHGDASGACGAAVAAKRRRRHWAVKPPSTSKLCPTTNEDLLEESQITASAISSEVPIRPIGCMAVIVAWFSALSPTNRRYMSVSIAAGNTALMRMPCLPNSTAADFVQTDDRVFAGSVDLDARKRDHTRHRGRIHNGPSARLEHGRDLMPHAQPHALHVDVHDLVIGLHGLLQKRRRRLLDARVVEGEIEPAEPFQRGAR